MKKIAVYTGFSILFTAFALCAFAQKSPAIEHIAFYVVNLKKSTAFYQNIIGLDTIPEPFHDGKHTWFKIGEGVSLHLIEGAKEATPHNKNTHLCFSVPAMDPFIARLKEAGIEYENWLGAENDVTVRVDGVKQLWFKDLDGYWIEVNDAKH